VRPPDRALYPGYQPPPTSASQNVKIPLKIHQVHTHRAPSAKAVEYYLQFCPCCEYKNYQNKDIYEYF
jgi:hypothetical protein